MSQKQNVKKNDVKSRVNIIFTMMALVVIALATATYAWFTLSLSTKVNNLEVQVTAGNELKIHYEYKSNLEDYLKEVSEDNINTQIKSRLSFSQGLPDIKMDAVTSRNGKDLFPEKSTSTPYRNTDKKYIEFVLYFMSSSKMDVYLTEADSTDGNDGTKVHLDGITNKNSAMNDVIRAVRISFTPAGYGSNFPGNGTGDTPANPPLIYEPNHGSVNTSLGNWGGETQKVFRNPAVGNADAKLFTLDNSNNYQQTVVVRIWLEGDDAQCKDAIKEAKFKTRLRFEGREG